MKLYAFLADGFETVEALGVVDILRRGRVDVITVSVMGRTQVVSSHNIPVIADCVFENCDFSDGDAIFLPGGLAGTDNLEAHEGLSKVIDEYFVSGRIVSAICAAPRILGHHNILNGKNATCYPGFEKDLYGANVKEDGVVTDGYIVTGKGMGKTVDMGLALLKLLEGTQKADDVKYKIMY